MNKYIRAAVCVPCGMIKMVWTKLWHFSSFFLLPSSFSSANLHSALLLHDPQSPSFCTIGSSSPLESRAATMPKATSIPMVIRAKLTTLNS